jgi:hypothetical protein
MVLILAGCSALRGLQHQQTTGITTMAPPAEEMLVEPVIQSPNQSPKISQPEMPRIASRTPTPNAKDSAPRKNAAPPPKRPPTPKLAETVIVQPADLVGFDFSSVLQVLRRPDTVQSNALSVVWTYSEPSCMLQLFFYPDIQTKVFHLLKHDLKGAADGVAERNACMRDIMAMKNDEPPSAN